MPPEGRPSDSTLRWLNHARADLALARVPLPSEGLYEHLCFHAHQAAEKGLKAILLHFGIEFPFTHNLQTLLSLLPQTTEVPEEVAESVDLNPYAVAARYPSLAEPVTHGEYLTAVRQAEAVSDRQKPLSIGRWN